MYPGLKRYRPVEPDRSALLLAQQDLCSISAPAFSYAPPAGFELRRRDQLAGSIGLTAERVLTTLVTELVDCGADPGRIWSTLKVKTMAAGELADRWDRWSWCRFGDWRFARWQNRGTAPPGERAGKIYSM